MTRKALARYGPWGRSVSLWIEGDRVTVQWWDRGRRRKKSWANSVANRRDARAWALAFTEARQPSAEERIPPTIAQLWQQFATAEFPTIRPRTQKLYGDYWRQWSVYVGPEAVAEDLGPGTMATFRSHLEDRKLAPGTIGQTLHTVKLVYAWALRHQVIQRAEVRAYQYKVAKDKRLTPPGEYRGEELAALLAQLPLERSTTWRAHAVLALCGYQGARQNAVLHLRWEDVDWATGTVTWRARWDKTGREWSQPLRAPTVAVLRAVAKRTGGLEGWVFPAASTKSGREVYSAQSLWRALREAERRAGIAHQPRRGAHGLRRMLFNDVLAVTGDLGAAMAAIHDTDLRVASRYLQGRDDRVREAFAVLDGGQFPEINTQ